MWGKFTIPTKGLKIPTKHAKIPTTPFKIPTTSTKIPTKQSRSLFTLINSLHKNISHSKRGNTNKLTKWLK